MPLNSITITEPFNSSLSLEESKIMYQQFFNSHLNNDFFLNEKNRPVLEKIHEELHFIFTLFTNNFHVDFDIFWMGKSLTDFISGHSEFIDCIDIGVSFNENFTNYQHNRFSHLDQLTHYLFDLYGITYQNILEKDLIPNTFYSYLSEIIEFKGKHFPIKLFPSLRNDNTVIRHYPFEILRAKLKVYSIQKDQELIPFFKNIESYVEHIEYKEPFIASLLSKTVLYKNDSLDFEHVEYDFNEYIIPLLSTYADLSIVIESPAYYNHNYIKDSLNKIIAYQKLNQKLTPKNNNSIKKTKI